MAFIETLQSADEQKLPWPEHNLDPARESVDRAWADPRSPPVPDAAHLPYRPAAGVMLLNAAGLVWVGQRIDNPTEAWQMPQGGLDPGEEAEAAALRELEEETGIMSGKVRVIARAARTLDYDLPPELLGKLWKGRYRGQRQTWFLARFLGDDADIDIQTRHPEFRAWQWVEPARLPDLIVPFKRQLYIDVLAEFAGHLG